MIHLQIHSCSGSRPHSRILRCPFSPAGVIKNEMKNEKTHLEGPEQCHVVTEGIAAEACATVQSRSSVSGVVRQDEGVLVGQRARYGQNRVQTLEHYSTQHHLPQVGFNAEVSQVESQLRQLLTLVHGVHGLNTRYTVAVAAVVVKGHTTSNQVFLGLSECEHTGGRCKLNDASACDIPP